MLPRPLSAVLLLVMALTSQAAWAHIFLLVSDDKVAYTTVASAIESTYGGPVSQFNMRGTPGTAKEAAFAYFKSGASQLVAIGLLAAQTAREQHFAKQVVFCQVINHEDYDLTAPWMKGVSALPPADKQFRVWKTLDPKLRRIVMITGPNFNQLADEASRAATATGLEIERKRASSDREATALFKKMGDETQGLWLVPDSSILTVDAMRDLMTLAARRGVAVLVFSPRLLPLGGLLSVSTDHNDIARQVIARLRAAEESNTIPGDDIAPLGVVVTEINPQAAAQLNLTVPTTWKGPFRVE